PAWCARRSSASTTCCAPSSAGPGRRRAMLRSLRVNDFALIEDLVLSFGAGLNAVTGETGAGKSLLQRALAIAAGHRAGSEMVRAGCEAARVEAVFAPGPEATAVQARLAALGIPA